MYRRLTGDNSPAANMAEECVDERLQEVIGYGRPGPDLGFKTE